MSKYSSLRDHLMNLKSDEWNTTFSEIEDILGFTLPKSAYTHHAWWANEKSPKTHVQKKQWQSAGFGTENLNREKKTVTFIRFAKMQKNEMKDVKKPKFKIGFNFEIN